MNLTEALRAAFNLSRERGHAFVFLRDDDSYAIAHRREPNDENEDFPIVASIQNWTPSDYTLP